MWKFTSEYIRFKQISTTCTPGLLVKNRKKKGYTQNGFQGSFFKLIRKLVKEGKVKPGFSFHGQRHTVGKGIADGGGGEKAGMAMLGHLTPNMVHHYSDQYDRKKAAIRGNEILQSTIKRPEPK